MSKRIIISVVVLAVIVGGVIVFSPALRAKLSPKVNEANISYKPGPDDVELIDITEPPASGESTEAQSPHAPNQVQGDVSEIPDKIETNSK